MRITRWGEYGILCCIYLAGKHEQQGTIGAAEIAETQRIPLQYAQQILHRLRKGGVIKSIRGPHGGFKLSKTPAETTLKEILFAAEGATFEVICEEDPVYPTCCPHLPDCCLRYVWYDLKEAVDNLLHSRTLASLLDRHNMHHASTNGTSDPIVQLAAKPHAQVLPQE